MRILMVPSSFAPNVGGVEEVVAQLCGHWQRSTHEAFVLTNQQPTHLATWERIGGTEVRRTRFRVPHASLRGVAGWALLSQHNRRRVSQWSQAFAPDIVNLHCVSTNLPYALLAARVSDAPFVVSLHGELGNDATGLYRDNPRFLRQWRNLLVRADAVTAPSHFVLGEAERVLGRSLGSSATVVPNGVDLDLFASSAESRSSPPTRRTVLAVGRLVPPKGFDILLSAWERGTWGPDVELVIAGDGPQRAELERMADNCAAPVRFLGGLDRREVAAHMAHASVFVLPSLAEPQGLVLLEAMAACVPVVAASGGGVSEIVRPEIGVLVPPGNATFLARAIRKVLDNAPAATRRADAARQAAGAFTWRRCAEGYLDVFERARARTRSK